MRKWNGLVLFCSLFFTSVSLASNAIFTITPSTSAVTLRSDGTTSVIYTVTNNRPVSVPGLTINSGYLTTGRVSGLTIQNNSCTSTLGPNVSCQFGIIIQGSNQPSTFILRPTVCESHGRLCSNTGASGQLSVNVVPVSTPPYAYLAANDCLNIASPSTGCFGANSKSIPLDEILVFNAVDHSWVARVPRLFMTQPFITPGSRLSNGMLSTTSVAVSLDGTRVYVAEQPNSHNLDNNADIAVLSEGATSTLLQRIMLPTNRASHFFIAVTPDGKTLYVTATDLDTTGKVYAINLVTNAVTEINRQFSTPVTVAISPDGSRAFIADTTGGNDQQGSVSVIDTSTNALITALDNTGSSSFNLPLQLAVSPDGSMLYVLNENLGSAPYLLAITTNSYAIQHTLSLTGYADTVQGLTLSQDGNYAYVSGSNGGLPVLLQIINPMFSEDIMPISADFFQEHGGLALTPDQSALWMAPGLGNGKMNTPSLSRNPAWGVEIVTGLLTPSPIVTPVIPPIENTFLIQYGAFIN